MFDAERQIRFLYPPVFFAGSVLWAFYLDPAKKLREVLAGSPWQPSPEKWPDLVIALAGASGALIFTGFIIGSITVFLLRVMTWRRYEAGLWKKSRDRVSQHLGLSEDEHALYLSATLDHELIPEKIHRWLLRRWSMFYVCANSAMGLLLAWVLLRTFRFELPRVYWAATVTTFVMFLGLAAFNWWDTMGMLNFQSRVLKQPKVIVEPTSSLLDSK